MAEVQLASASQKQVWETKYFQEYIRESGFKDYMSNTNNGNKTGVVLCRFDELSKEAGKIINVPFIGRLKSATGVTGTGVLDGNEESLTNFNCGIPIDWRRNAVRVPKSTAFQTQIDLWNASKDALRNWEAEKVRDDIIKAMCSVVPGGANTDTVVNMELSTAAQRNAWTVANVDRMLFGGLISNYNAVFATAMANVATPAGKASAAGASLAKRIAKNADPHIRPYKTETGREFFIAFHGTRSFRDIKADATIVSANTNARAREDGMMKENPLFQDGDILYDGVIHHEVPEIDSYAASTGVFNGAGTAGADIRPVFVCGTGAVGIAWGQQPTVRTDMIKDYGFRPGVAIEELIGVKKMVFNGVQNSVLTWLVAAGADS
jgi:hypothetical protein